MAERRLGHDHGRRRDDALSGIDHYQHRTSADAGGTWSAVATGAAVTISAEADSQAEFRAVDGAGNAGAWTAVGASAMARIDRTAPTVPAVAGGAIAWQSAANVTVSASGSGDSLSGLAAPGYAYETSLNGGAWSVATAGTSATVSAEGTTTVRFRSIDNAGNVSAWSTVGNASTVKLDRTPPAVPASVSGGSSAWASVASKTIIAAGGTDSGSGISGYQYETAFNGGAWSAPAAGASVAVSAEGTTTVRFRTVDNAGNTSAWSAVAAGSTVKLDRTGPAAATASGGSLSWLNSHPRRSRDRRTDTVRGSMRPPTSTAPPPTGGSTWSLPPSGSAVTVAAEGETLVQFRASDIAGNPGAWGPRRRYGRRHGAARPRPADRSHGRGRLGGVDERRLGHHHRDRIDRLGQRPRRLPVAHVGKRRLELVGLERDRRRIARSRERRNDARRVPQRRQRRQHVGRRAGRERPREHR